MRVFVTGGTGFVGAHVVETLREEGHQIDVYTRRVGLVSEYDNVRYRNTIPQSFDYYEVVYLLAGVLGGRGISKETYNQAHVYLPDIICQRITEQHVVYMSTAYTVAVPPSKHVNYVQTKLAGEAIVKETDKHTIVRPGFIYGPHDHHHFPLFKWINTLGSWCPIPGKGTNRVCPTYVTDVAHALLPNNLKEGELKLAGEIVSIDGLIQGIASELGVGIPTMHIPAIFKKDFFGVERIFETDLEPTPLNLGLRETIEWYRISGWL